MSLKIVIFVVVALFAVETYAQSIQCWVCGPGTNCGDPFAVDTSSMTLCKVGYSCRKTVYKNKTRTYTLRDCAQSNSLESKCTSMSNGDFSLTECICKGNTCNTADNTRHLSSFLLLMVAFITILLGVVTVSRR